MEINLIECDRCKTKMPREKDDWLSVDISTGLSYHLCKPCFTLTKTFIEGGVADGLNAEDYE